MPMVFSGVALFFACMIGGVSILGTLFWIWMLIDCVMNKKISDMQKALWVVLIVFTHIIGALIYFFVGRRAQPKQPTYQYYEQSRTTYHYDAPPTYRSYEQGYQAPPLSQQNNDTPIYPEQAQRSSTDYEQPQAMYPHEQQED